MIESKKNLREIRRSALPMSDRSGLLRLDMNESLAELPMDLIRSRLQQLSSTDLQGYPCYAGLMPKLAEYYGVSQNCVLATNGSDSGAKLIFDTFVEAGDKVCMMDPSFAMHGIYAKIAGANSMLIALSNDFSFPYAAYREALAAKPKLMILVSPHNPTGAVVDLLELAELLVAAAAQDTLIYVDEAYGEFAAGPSAIELLTKHDNLLVSRTFSKAAGLAGVRLGVMLGNPELLGKLRLTQPTFDVNSFAALLGELVCDNPDLVRRNVQAVADGKAYLLAELRTRELDACCGGGCFALIRPRCRPLALKEELLRDGVAIAAGFSQTALADYVRVTIGPPAVMRQFLDAFDAAEAKLLAETDDDPSNGSAGL